jgi:hypothetical protein
VKVGDRVKVELSGHVMDKRIGEVTAVTKTEMLGTIYSVRVPALKHETAFTATCLRRMVRP